MKPVWLLDIDGVINAVDKNFPTHVWPEHHWTLTHVDSQDVAWPIRWAKPVIDFITQVHLEGLAEIRWHTTWQEEALVLATHLGLPEFPVHPAPEFHNWTLSAAKGWWKLPGAWRVIHDEQRPLLWTDDDIDYDTAAKAAIPLMRELQPTLAVCPATSTGLTPKHVNTIGQWLPGKTWMR